MLSVVLPVHNVQGSLRSTIRPLLEYLPEVAPQFELILVDDGSTDATGEAAAELAPVFPQMQVLCHRQRLGMAACWRRGCMASRGERFILGNDLWLPQLSEFDKLLRTLGQFDAVLARPIGASELSIASTGVAEADAPLLALRRDAAAGLWSAANGWSMWFKGLARVGRRRCEIELRPQYWLSRRTLASVGRIDGVQPARRSESHLSRGHAYADAIKRFARGE